MNGIDNFQSNVISSFVISLYKKLVTILVIHARTYL